MSAEGVNTKSSLYWVQQYEWSHLKNRQKRRELAKCKFSTLNQ